MINLNLNSAQLATPRFYHLRTRLMTQLGTLFAALSIGLCGLVFAGPAEDTKEAMKLLEQNKLDAALVKVNAALAVQPKDAQSRFTKGMILIEQKKTTEAIQIFTGITEDFPELPEPYNNLAALYAMQGNYDKAKAALELAIHTHPTYGTAYENLGDIYAQLARRSYDKAFQLDKTNSAAQSKLALVKSLFPASRSTSAPVQVAVAETPKAAPVAPPVVQQAPTPPPVVKQPEPAKPVAPPTPPPVAKVEPAKAPTPTPTAPPPVAAAVNDEAGVRAALAAWSAAWSAQDVAGYLSAYGPNFETPDGLGRKAWEKQRKERIEAPSNIDVALSDMKITVNGNEATANFRQAYKSDRLTTNSNKTIKLTKSGERWLIRSERSGK